MTLRGIALCLVLALPANAGFAADGESHHPQVKPEASGAGPGQETLAKKEQKAADPKHEATANHPIETTQYNNSLGASLLRNLVQDQKAIWTSPSRLRPQDATWLVPLGGLTAALLASDREFSKHLSNSPHRLVRSNTVSNLGAASLAGAAGGLYLWGKITQDEHKRETGFLSGEALLNALAVNSLIQVAAGRERPFQDGGSGNFFHHGTSFPSDHAAAAWSVAGVIAHQYPGPLTKLLAYGAASAVSAARITGKKHFPSDVLVGSAVGWFIGQQVYRAHHNPELGGGEWRSIGEFFRGGGDRSPANQGSPYVPLDSWIYPAFDRLAALGMIDSGFAGMRPWTRLECARLVGEVEERINDPGAGLSEADKIYSLLRTEFRDKLEGSGVAGKFRARVESLYTRVTGVSGKPLTDGYYFGQTINNDYGRPYQEGFNSADGFSAWATAGRWVSYVRAEYQHASSAPALPEGARQYIFSVNVVPSVPPPTPFVAVNRFRLLDAYVGLSLENWQVSFGKQSLWWGPSKGGPLMFSDNAGPVNMFRISRVSPFKLPSVLGWLGPIRLEWFLGQLAGHEFVFQTDTGIVGQFGRPLDRQPFIQGQKISLKPSQNFEFSVSVTVLFAGGPTPLTSHNLFKSYSISNGSNTQQGSTSDPGDRRSGVDFSYRVPGMRNWLTFYGDAFAEDEFSPLGYPRKSAYQGGVYMPRIPGIPKLDLRLEGGSTVPPDFQDCIGCFYVNHRYPNGYTNFGNLLGSSLGRGSQGEQAWSTYWLTARDKIQLNYRHQKVDGQVIPGGGTLSDWGVTADFWLRATVKVSGSVQYEKWAFPVLASGSRSNVTSSFQLTFWPHTWNK